MVTCDARYTVDGPDEVEARVAADQRRVTDAVRALVPGRSLVALVLAGGYGRGEGGFQRLDGRVVPYNDYDYFLVVRGLGRGALAVLRRRLHVLGEALGQEFGLEVDFAVFEQSRLARLPECLMYSELKWRHRTLFGDVSSLEVLRSPPVDELPLAEFSRMMLNRGALLLMNAQALASGSTVTPAGAERFIRYISKGVLAAGDAWLASVGQYHPSSTERSRRLQAWCAVDSGRASFAELYALASRIKQGGVAGLGMGPERFPELQRRAVAAWLASFRSLESSRLGRPVADWSEYAGASVSKGQDSRGLRRAWNVALAVRGGAVRAVRAGARRLLRHPRERIMAALPLLLGGDDRRSSQAAAPLGLSQHAGHAALVEAFFTDWRRYC